MKKKLCLLLTLLISFALCGCEQKQASADLSLEQILTSVVQSQPELPELIQLSPQDEDFSVFVAGDYGIDPATVADGLIAYADGVEASEIVLLVLTDAQNAPAAQAALMAYAQERAGLFDGYAPAQAAMARNAKALFSGKYVSLLICPDSAKAEEAFESCFREMTEDGLSAAAATEYASEAAETNSVEAQNSNRFDSGAILEAWRCQDASSLSERNLQILSAAAEVIARETTDAMNDYEKELAIHDWITHWSSFDMSAFSRNPGSGEGTDSDTPYGVLMNRSGNCWGYSSTFQLFMDMLEIECLTVYGTPRSSGVEHAWNMVRLDGEWYCVDAAWDDPIGGSPNHRYFNKTSEDFRNSGIHSWDESAYPEATGKTYGYP